MKFKFLNAVVAIVVLAVSSFANAGLILGSQEFLELGATKGKTQFQVEAMIAGDNSLVGYVLATNVDMANIWKTLPFMQDSITGWRSLLSNTQTVSEILMWASVGTSAHDFGRSRTGSSPDGQYSYDKIAHGFIYYKNKDKNKINSGQFSVHLDNGSPIAYRKERWTLGSNMANVDTSTGVGWFERDNVHSLFVRATTVPEPTTLAIFALGMIGLASRRFKKKS